MKCSKFGILLILLVCFTVSASHAVDIDNATVEIADSNVISSVGNLNDKLMEEPDAPDSNEQPDVPDLIEDENNIVTPDNIKAYFKYGVLNSKYKGQTLTFKGNFTDLGQLTVKSNDVVIQGKDAIFKNTVFNVEGNGVLLKNLTFDLNKAVKDNDGAAIRVNGYDVTLSDLNINYVVPSDVEAYAIYSNGYTGYSSDSLKIINSNINFEGHNNNINVYNCAIKIINYEDSLIQNNTITTALPLKDVNHGAHGTSLDSDFVVSVGIENSNNLKFINNTIISEVNYRQDSLYPTLDAFLISKCDNALIEDNHIYMGDFITYPGLDNYLYGMDIYNLNNLTVRYNEISIVTTGGRLAAGTAYPIQISGPISKVNITRNNLYSFSNGPNIGIYSQNYYGSTELSITYNRINVTGLAGTHEWALVAGVETQDSDSVVENNIIEVHSVGAVGVDDNIYGVSYRQSTDGDHKYSIKNNTVYSDGFKSVYLLDSKNSTVADNLLISYNDNARNGYDGFNYGDLSHHDNINFENNQVIRAFDYFANQNNNFDNGEEYSYTVPVNNNGISNVIDGSGINPVNNKNKPTYNPIIPGTSSHQSEMYTPGIINSQTTNEESENKENNQHNDGIDDKSNEKGDNSHSSTNSSSDIVNNVDSTYVSNNTDVAPSDSGSQSLVGMSESSGGSSSVSKKAFELEDLTKSEFIPSIFYVIATLILLIVGYRRKNSNSEK